MNDDTISRKSVIDAVHTATYGFICGAEDGDEMTDADKLVLSINKAVCGAIKALPSAQPERLTDDDFETIRIHLNAYKENLGNQHRWEEAEEYQRIIDRFMAFASAQPEHLVKESGNLVKGLVNDCISRRAAVDAFDGTKVNEENCTEYDIGYNDGIDFAVSSLSVLPSVQPERMTNRQWVDFLSAQFDISRTSAKEMLHGMMRWKKEDNFKKMFNGGKT